MTFSKMLVVASFVLAAGTAPALAADWGGIKDMGGGVAVPVPAPAPVPTYDYDSDWYVGLAIGANFSQSATIKDTDRDYLGDTTPGVWARDSDDIGTSPLFGLSFGRYITPSLRAEIAIDYTPDAQISRGNTLGYVVTNSAPKFSGGVVSIDTNAYAVERTDTVKLARTTGLVNLLYDIPTGTRFTPYVGGGVGFINLDLRKQGVGGVGTLMDDSDTAFAYHLDAGVGINLQGLGLFSNVSLFDNTTLDIGYRFTAADNFDFTARDGTSSTTDFRSDAVTFGFRKGF
jgi:opacity protein-like surface antigen